MDQLSAPLVDHFKTLVNRGRLLIVTDLDGTIAPIVSNPNDSQVDLRARNALERLADAGVAVALMTGRSALAGERLLNISNVSIVGANGAEYRRDGVSTLAPEFEPHAAEISRRLGSIFAAFLQGLGRVEVQRDVLGNFEIQTTRGMILVEQKGVTSESPQGISHMYYFAGFSDSRVMVESIERMRYMYSQEFIGGLADLVACEVGEGILSFTALLQAPKWQALVRLIQHETEKPHLLPLRSVAYFGDSDPDAAALRMMRVVDKLTHIHAVGVVVANDATTDPRFARKQESALEAATIRLNEIHENAQALLLLAQLVEEHVAYE